MEVIISSARLAGTDVIYLSIYLYLLRHFDGCQLDPWPWLSRTYFGRFLQQGVGSSLLLCKAYHQEHPDIPQSPQHARRSPDSDHPRWLPSMQAIVLCKKLQTRESRGSRYRPLSQARASSRCTSSPSIIKPCLSRGVPSPHINE